MIIDCNVNILLATTFPKRTLGTRVSKIAFHHLISIFYFLFFIFLLSGCMASKDNKRYEEKEKNDESMEKYQRENKNLEDGDLIIKTAKLEQNNEMYSPETDSTSLYWINKVIAIKNHSKCNIFALNTLYKAGFNCPKQNARTVDLMNESLFSDILPIINISSLEDIKKGDLIVWNGHVIIFESLDRIKNDDYAVAIWAGTRQADNGKTVINNVSYGRYPLKGKFIIRRPVRKRI